MTEQGRTMADAGSSIFNKKATEKLRNPDDLDKFVRVTNPSVWVILAACVILIAGLLAWGFLGAVTTSVSATGAVVDGAAVCFLSAEDIAQVEVGETANVGGERMTVADVTSVPLSAGEAKEVLHGDYLVSALMEGDWAYLVTFEGDTSDLSENVPLTVHITTERVSPISLVLKNWG